ncbi:MAG: hypothetical protein QM472_15125 [Spirochaetota bacterium]|nr:hypothetical protein [Spirochaetota bacterium]HPV99354.1 hypothetical protein [Spirochaetota bacterium]
MRGKNRKARPASRPCRMAATVLALVTLMAGCVSVKTSLTGVSTNARTMESMDYEVLGEAEGMHSAFRLFWILPVTPRADREKAVEEAVASKGGDNLIFVRTWQERQHWVLGTVDIIHVRGLVVRYR